MVFHLVAFIERYQKHIHLFTYRFPIWRLIRYIVDLILSVLLMWMFVCCGLPLMFFWLQTCITIMGNNWWAPCPPNCAGAWFVRRHLNNAGQPVPADDTWHTNKGSAHARCVICEHLLTLTEWLNIKCTCTHIFSKIFLKLYQNIPQQAMKWISNLCIVHISAPPASLC